MLPGESGFGRNVGGRRGEVVYLNMAGTRELSPHIFIAANDVG